jgi:hypothetical protein
VSKTPTIPDHQLEKQPMADIEHTTRPLVTERGRYIVFIIAVIVGAILVDISVMLQARGEGMPYPNGSAQCSGSYVQSGGFKPYEQVL